MTTFTATYYKWTGGLWAFDDVKSDTWEEPMCNGSEVAMDYWYETKAGHPPSPDSTMVATVSNESSADTTFKMWKTGGDEFGTTYEDQDGKAWWLCPFLNFVFGPSPETLYVTIGQVE